MKKVLVLTQFLNIGGLERLVCSLSKGLKKETSWEPVVCYYDRLPGLPSLKADLVSSRIPVKEILKGKGFSFKLISELYSFTRKNKIKLIHTHDIGPLVYAVLLKLIMLGRIKIVHTQHSYIYQQEKRRYRIYEKFCAYWVDRYACVSSEIEAKSLKTGISKNQAILIQNGVGFPDDFIKSESDRIKIREDLIYKHGGISAPLKDQLERVKEWPWVICLARLHVGKGQEEVLQVWSKLSEEIRRQCAFIFVGPETTSGYLKKLQKDAAGLPERQNIIFAGSSLVPDMWLKSANLFISGSRYEGMPLSALEAIGAGIPALLSNIDGHKIFSDLPNRLVGFFPIENSRRGAMWIEEQLQEFHKIGSQYYADRWNDSFGVRSRFGISQMIAKYSEVYSKI